jgi:hypothetical protein
MIKEIMMVSILLAAVLVSGCTTEPAGGDASGMSGDEIEASAYDQIEQELEEAIEDIDLEDLEGELLT